MPLWVHKSMLLFYVLILLLVEVNYICVVVLYNVYVLIHRSLQHQGHHYH